MKTVAIIQARMGSERFPGKSIELIKEIPMFVLVFYRVQLSNVDEVIVATSVDKKDDAIAMECKQRYIPCFRGSEDDVLNRYFEAARWRKTDLIIRITADCPLIDGDLITDMLEFYKNIKYSSQNLFYRGVENCGASHYNISRTFPKGEDIQIFDYYSLYEANLRADTKEEREHVFPYIHNNFIIKSYVNAKNLAGHRWTVDYPEDLEFVRKIYKLYDGYLFGINDILNNLEKNPELMKESLRGDEYGNWKP